MSGRFSFSRPGRGAGDPWFRIGSLDVGTVMLVVLLSVVSLFVFALEPIDKPIMSALWMFPDQVLSGEVWRVVTWPFSNASVTLWTAVGIFFFWYFGNEIEGQIGKKKFAWLFLGLTLVYSAAYIVLSLVLPNGSRPLAGLGTIEFVVLLLYIAEYPHRRFFFNIPGWVIAAVLVGIQVIQLLGYRDWFGLLALFLGLGLSALVARSVGLLAEYHWVPNLHRRRRTPKSKSSRTPPRSTSRPTVVQGPWQPPVSRDQAELDALLDKIHQYGMDSLSDQERQHLLVLRDRLRGR